MPLLWMVTQIFHTLLSPARCCSVSIIFLHHTSFSPHLFVCGINFLGFPVWHGGMRYCLLHMDAMAGWFLIFSVVIGSRLFQPSRPLRLCGFTVCCSVLLFLSAAIESCFWFVCIIFLTFSLFFSPFKRRLVPWFPFCVFSNTCHSRSGTSNARASVKTALSVISLCRFSSAV